VAEVVPREAGGLPVTEAEWLAADTFPLVEYLRGKASDRKLRLFAAACCRRILPLIRDPYGERVIEVAERFAEGEVSTESLRLAREAVLTGRLQPRADAPHRSAEDHAWVAVASASGEEERSFSLCVAAVRWAAWEGQLSGLMKLTPFFDKDVLAEIVGNYLQPAALNPAWLTWDRGTVPRLAEMAHRDRDLPSGHLKVERLAPLVEALQNAGCGDAEFLDHLRGSGPHVRGCWAVDRLTGRA
jgi:hypothetical protein